MGVLTNISRVFFSFNAVASVLCIYLRVGRVRPRGGGGWCRLEGKFDFFCQGGYGGGGG